MGVSPGKRILIVSPGFEASDYSLERFYQRAFSELGCVAEIRCIMKGGAGAALGDRIRRRLGRVLATGLLPDMEAPELLESARRFAPDVTFVVRGERLTAEAVHALDRLSAGGCYNIYPDNPFVIPGPGAIKLRESLGQYRAVFTFSRSLVPVFLQLGATRCHWLPFGFDPAVHKPIASMKAGVSYFGVWGPIQEAWLGPLSEMGLRIYGGGWKKLDSSSPLVKCWRPGEGIGLDMAGAVAKSALVFNLIRAEHGCAHSMKTFELPACAGVVVVNRTQEQQLFFREDRECVYFDSAEELNDKLRFYGANAAARERIAVAALEAAQPHTYRSRAEDLLGFVESGELAVESRYRHA